MVYFSSLEKISRFIDENQLKPMMPWSERYGRTASQRNCRYVRKLIVNIRKILNLLSGGDVADMLKAVLLKSEFEELCENSKETKALENLAQIYVKTDLKKRHYFARALKESGISHDRIRRFGFNVSKTLWTHCRDGKQRNLGGGKKISEPMREAIKSYLYENSNIVANRLVTNKDEDDENFSKRVPARSLETNKIELYKKFPLADKMSIGTFYKYMRKSGEFKKPHRLTDLCDYCEKGKELEKKIAKNLETLKYDWQDRVDMRFVQHFLAQKSRETRTEEEKKWLEEVKSEVAYYDSILFHKNIAKAQREAYNRDRTDIELLRNKIMIEVDFKQKIVIGLGPRQINADYYESRNRLRTCLGFGVYYVDSTDKINTINFDIISSDPSQEARTVVRGFRILREQKFFKEIDKPSYIIWMDCGRHFRNNLVSGYLLKELTQEKVNGVNITTNMNFFCEKHGKSMRDAHFSMITKFINDASMQKKLICTNDVVKAIENGQLLANENRLHDANRTKNPRRTEPITTIAYELDYSRLKHYIEHIEKPYNYLTLKNIENLYNYRANLNSENQLEISSSVLSNQNELMRLNLNVSDNEGKGKVFNYELPLEETFEEVLSSSPLLSGIDYIRGKQIRMNHAFSLRKTPISKSNQSVIKIEPTRVEMVTTLSSEVEQQNRVNEPKVIVSIRQYEENVEIPKSPLSKENPNLSTEETRVEANRQNRVDESKIIVPIRKDDRILQVPKTCRTKSYGDKAPCESCKVECSLSVERLLKDEIGIKIINQELKDHTHPQSRKGGRTKKDAIKELIDHYVYSHHIKITS